MRTGAHRDRLGPDSQPTREEVHAATELTPEEAFEAELNRASGPQPTLDFGMEPAPRHAGVALAEAPRPAPSFTPASELPPAVTETNPMPVLQYRIFYGCGPLPLAEEAAAAAKLAPVGLRCDMCATAYEPPGSDGDGDGGQGAPVSVDRVFLALRSGAQQAGWHFGRDFLRCPPCAAAWDSPVMTDGRTIADWDAEGLTAFARAHEATLHEVDADLDAFIADEVGRWKAEDAAARAPKKPRPALEAAPVATAPAGEDSAPGEPAEAAEDTEPIARVTEAPDPDEAVTREGAAVPDETPAGAS